MPRYLCRPLDIKLAYGFDLNANGLGDLGLRANFGANRSGANLCVGLRQSSELLAPDEELASTRTAQ